MSCPPSTSSFARPLGPIGSGDTMHGIAASSSTLRPLENPIDADRAAAAYSFRVPEKLIRSPADMNAWQNSKAYDLFVRFLVTLNNAVIGRNMSSRCRQSVFVDQVLKFLDELDSWIDATPPVEQPQRFGNAAFRTWHAKLTSSVGNLVENLLPENLKAASNELSPYIVDSFGNATRIDYGSGHEAAFCMFLACLYLLGLFRKDDCCVVVNKIFARYIEIVRKLQTTYNMEPAGSHGVWSLDDFQFLPFFFGSSQLVDHPTIQPRMFTDETVVRQNEQEFLFLGSIAQIFRVKTGPFAEHSNQLWNISGLPSWSKMNSGLLKMYRGEVLAKFPVVQHFLFGSILPFEAK